MFENGFHPIDSLRSRIDNWRAHPFQNIASGLIGALAPGAGEVAHAGFNRFNDYSLNHAQGINQARVTDQMGADTNDAMNRPLGGSLGGFEDSGNGPLAHAITGSGGYQGNYGSNQGWNQAQNWSNPSGFTGGSSVINDLMNQLPGGSNFSGGSMSHQDHLDAISNQQNFGGGMPGANYGVSNFMAGGSPMITGFGDPNGKYRARMVDTGG